MKRQNVVSYLSDNSLDDRQSNYPLALSQIVASVPEEVWQIIFWKAVLENLPVHDPFLKLSDNFSKLVAAKEKTFRILTCVSRSFSTYVIRALEARFIDFHQYFLRSNWLLSHLPN